MRPQGEARKALLQAAQRLAEQRRVAPLVGTDGKPLVGATWLELMAAANCGRDATQATLKNMVRAHDLDIVGHVREGHSDRPLAVYAPALQETTASTALAAAMSLWGLVP